MRAARKAVLDHDLGAIELGDARLNRRAGKIIAAIHQRPADSFPHIFDTDADLEAYYRFTNNPKVRAGAILHSHSTASWDRATKCGNTILLLHDTTEHTFDGDETRIGLSKRGKHQSFWSHVTLAVAATGVPQAFGVVGLRAYLCDDGVWTWARSDGSGEPVRKGSDRWIDGVHEVVETIPALEVIHVADREGDAYPMFCALKSLNQAFVIRACHNRTLADDMGKVKDALAGVEHCVVREVELASRTDRRPPKTKATHPTRDTRPAKLAMRATTAIVKWPMGSAAELPDALSMNVVEVNEVETPEGSSPIHWMLWTTLPVDTPEQIERVVDIYRRRWIIEEFFRSLKTGCAFSKRQAESLDALLRTQALLLPVAVALLNLRTLARTDPKLPWSAAISERQLRIVQDMQPKHKLTKRSNVRAVMLAIAAAGGHIKNNGEPGWITLGRGFDDILEREAGWLAAERWFAKGRP